jgi:uncharacterized protein (DUF305 family)
MIGGAAWLAATVGACGVALGQGAPGASYGPADVHFMQGMIAHHAQALVMVALIPSHTTNQQIHLVGQRIEISQKDEIGLMQRWLGDRHEPAPTVDSNHVAHMPDDQMAGMQMPGSTSMMMPGMLTEAQLAQLAQAKGPAFDRLFLEDMIRHHEGALTMVAALLHTNGAGQDPEIFRFAADVDADQRAEIRRMHAMLDGQPKTVSRP